MKNIAIITENFLHPWSPNDIEKFLGGSQECTVYLAEALQRAGYVVSVFLSGPTVCKTELRNGISYQDFSLFDLCHPWDTIILFKINPLEDDPRLENINIIFWSSDVEKYVLNDRYIKKRVCLTEYHRERNEWRIGERNTDGAFVIPHGTYKGRTGVKKPNTMLYCSSPDRGLETVIRNWEKILMWCPSMKLYVTYGYKIAEDIGVSVAKQAEDSLKKICNELDIEYKGNVDRKEMESLYETCEYWVLPLNNPDSELFCLNAIKAQNCGCIPVVYKKGALTETVGNYIDFDDFVKGNLKIRPGSVFPNYTWDEVVEKFWKPIL